MNEFAVSFAPIFLRPLMIILPPLSSENTIQEHEETIWLGYLKMI
jgi:hypothetical protein